MNLNFFPQLWHCASEQNYQHVLVTTTKAGHLRLIRAKTSITFHHNPTAISSVSKSCNI